MQPKRWRGGGSSTDNSDATRRINLSGIPQRIPAPSPVSWGKRDDPDTPKDKHVSVENGPVEDCFPLQTACSSPHENIRLSLVRGGVSRNSLPVLLAAPGASMIQVFKHLAARARRVLVTSASLLGTKKLLEAPFGTLVLSRSCGLRAFSLSLSVWAFFFRNNWVGFRGAPPLYQCFNHSRNENGKPHLQCAINDVSCWFAWRQNDLKIWATASTIY